MVHWRAGDGGGDDEVACEGADAGADDEDGGPVEAVAVVMGELVSAAPNCWRSEVKGVAGVAADSGCADSDADSNAADAPVDSALGDSWWEHSQQPSGKPSWKPFW
jgi:hypothetical protein